MQILQLASQASGIRAIKNFFFAATNFFIFPKRRAHRWSGPRVLKPRNFLGALTKKSFFPKVMSRALQVGTRKSDGNNIPFDLPLSTQNGGTGSSTGVSRASLGLATTDTPLFAGLQLTSPLTATYGGTGYPTTFTIGAVPYGKTSTTMDFTLPNTTTTPNYFTSTGTGSAGQAPAWKTPTQMRTDLSLATTSDVTFNSLDVKAGGIRTPSCNYRKKSDQSINSGTFTAITFSNGPSASYGEWDNNSWHPSSNSSFTTPSFSTGCLNVSGNVCFQQNVTGSRQVAIHDSGTGQYRYVIVPACTDNDTIVPFSWNIRCSSSNNTITLYAWQSSGGALNIRGSSTEGYTILSIAVCSATN